MSSGAFEDIILWEQQNAGYLHGRPWPFPECQPVFLHPKAVEKFMRMLRWVYPPAPVAVEVGHALIHLGIMLSHPYAPVLWLTPRFPPC